MDGPPPQPTSEEDRPPGRDPQEPAPETVTQILTRVRAGEGQALNELLGLVYEELRHLAAAIFAREAPSHTLQPTALVHEAWLKLAGHVTELEDRRHFFIVAGKAMRQVIADYARGKQRAKRRGGRRLTVDAALQVESRSGVDVVELHDSLNRLAERNARHASVAELRLFSGLSIEEAAEALAVSPRTVDADWAMAKAWLRRDLAEHR